MMAKFYMILFLISTGLLWGCRSGDGGDSSEEPASEEPAPTKAVTKPSNEKYNYSVYIENSGSINGYLAVSGDGSFKSNIFQTVAKISTLESKKSLSLYLVNSKIDTVATNVSTDQLEDYFITLNSGSFKTRSKKNGGSLDQSDLHDVIKSILRKTGPNDISLFISDCIFSPGKTRDATEYLDQQGSLIHSLIGSELRSRPLAILVLQFYAGFKGTYYDQNDVKLKGELKKRPYYIICFGKEEALTPMLEYARNTGNKGFQNYLFLTATKKYEIKPEIYGNDEYYEYDPERPLTVTDMQRGETDKRFRIECNVDFSALPVDDRYLENPANYEVGEGYSVEAVKRLTKNAKAIQSQEHTHKLILSATKPLIGKFAVALKKQMPAWVITSSLNADKGLNADSLEGKTFGLRYLLEGMYNAYAGYIPATDYFRFSISIKE